ncbi:MAG: hypothetical protein U9R15_05080 [Chloroflexota bacterium]|nr:hypothetical protein [Chloroflexota bacterium]
MYEWTDGDGEEGMNFEECKRGVSERIKAEPEWKFYAYPKALFMYDLVWKDAASLLFLSERIVRS